MPFGNVNTPVTFPPEKVFVKKDMSGIWLVPLPTFLFEAVPKPRFIREVILTTHKNLPLMIVGDCIDIKASQRILRHYLSCFLMPIL